MKRLSGVAIVAVAVSLLAPVSAGAIIQLDRGIAGARLDNTKAQVRAALGRPARIINGTNDFGPFTEFRYKGGIRVNFQGRRQVSAVSTTGLGDRTARGVGVGSTERRVRARVPRVRCRTFVGERICQRGRGRPGERVTVFFVENGRVEQVTVGFVID
jgi:hypothetical protein